MPSFELSKLQAVTGPRALSDTDRTAAQSQTAARALNTGAAGNAAGAGVSVEIGAALQAANVDTSTPPVDRSRVDEIRDALRDGTYPLVPTEIADAIIAAQYSFEIA